MAVYSGFFNSLKGDRKYYAEDMSNIVDSLITDGVFANVGKVFAVSANGGNDIAIAPGRAWFNSSWLYNSAIHVLTVDESEVLLDRYDAVVIEINRSETVRSGSIKIIKGTPSSEPLYPELANSEHVHQHALAFIKRTAGSAEINQADIINCIGTSYCPYITGILQVVNIDHVVAQWEDQWNQWFSNEVAGATYELSKWMEESRSEFDNWELDTKSSFESWFESLETILEGDVAANLALQILELQEKFYTLGKEHCIYYDVKDADGDSIEGSDGTPLLGKFVVGGAGTGSGECKLVSGSVTPDKLASETKAMFAPSYIYSQIDLDAGVSDLKTGSLYFVYE